MRTPSYPVPYGTFAPRRVTWAELSSLLATAATVGALAGTLLAGSASGAFAASAVPLTLGLGSPNGEASSGPGWAVAETSGAGPWVDFTVNPERGKDYFFVTVV
jgi:hypothetical protein